MSEPCYLSSISLGLIIRKFLSTTLEGPNTFNLIKYWNAVFGIFSLGNQEWLIMKIWWIRLEIMRLESLDLKLRNCGQICDCNCWFFLIEIILYPLNLVFLIYFHLHKMTTKVTKTTSIDVNSVKSNSHEKWSTKYTFFKGKEGTAFSLGQK